jgi:hypothetical protein
MLTVWPLWSCPCLCGPVSAIYFSKEWWSACVSKAPTFRRGESRNCPGASNQLIAAHVLADQRSCVIVCLPSDVRRAHKDGPSKCAGCILYRVNSFRTFRYGRGVLFKLSPIKIFARYGKNSSSHWRNDLVSVGGLNATPAILQNPQALFSVRSRKAQIRLGSHHSPPISAATQSCRHQTRSNFNMASSSEKRHLDTLQSAKAASSPVVMRSRDEADIYSESRGANSLLRRLNSLLDQKNSLLLLSREFAHKRLMYLCF